MDVQEIATVEEGREARTDAVILRIARRVNERVLFTQHLASVALHSAVHPTGVAPLSASLAQLSLDVEHALLTPCRELSHSPLTHTHTHTHNFCKSISTTASAHTLSFSARHE
jgi:hypothetical protein